MWYNIFMENLPKNNIGPCTEKQCGWCCDPVRVNLKYTNIEEVEKKIATNGKKLWEKREEMLIPEVHPDTVRLSTYDCNNFDKESKQCLDYENRPKICKNTSCINSTEKTVDQQHKEQVEEKFVSFIPRRF